MQKDVDKSTGGQQRVFIAGAALMFFFWVADSWIDAGFGQASLFDELFFPSIHEVAIRSLAITVLALFIIYISRILTGRRKLDEELKAALVAAEGEKSRSEAIVAAMGDAVSIQDANLRILYQNEAHQDMMGAHAGEFCFAAYQHKERACDGCHLVLSFLDGRVHRRETCNQGPAGLRYVEIISSPLKDLSGTIIAGIETVRDITERKLLENQLRKQMVAIEASMDGIAILNEKEEYTYLNPAHARIYGFDSPGELLGRTWRALYYDEEALRFDREVLPVLMETGSWRGESVGRKRDGGRFPQEVSLTHFGDGGTICVVRDITDRKKAEDQIRKLNEDLERRAAELLASNEELEAFSYSLSHDLRNQLTRMYLSAQALDEGYSGVLDETGRHFARGLRTSLEHMEELIEAMLVLSRASRSEMRCERVDLGELALEVSSELEQEEPGRHVEFVVSAGESVQGDPELLRVMMENLLGNAWKYTRKRTAARIEFRGTEEGGERFFSIQDNGIGFAMENAERIFKPFERLHKNGDFPGTGIGLATVQRIVERHGGRAWCEGEVDKGATFYFSLK